MTDARSLPTQQPKGPTPLEEALRMEFGPLIALEQTRASFRHVTGWLHNLEGFALMRLASAPDCMPTGEVVEIGSFKGLSTCWLASGLRVAQARKFAPAKVHAIDHFAGSPEHQPGQQFADPDIAAGGSTFASFTSNIERAGLSAWVAPMRASSREGAQAWAGLGAKPIRVLFIDGDHSYEASREDFELWQRFVPLGGYVCFHDVGTWPGVTRFVQEVIAQPGAHANLAQVLAIGTLMVFRRQGAMQAQGG